VAVWEKTMLCIAHKAMNVMGILLIGFNCREKFGLEWPSRLREGVTASRYGARGDSASRSAAEIVRRWLERLPAVLQCLQAGGLVWRV
jgi:hypothetical protein